jgi:diguanylate cyclase (GGDEF)-like protein
MVECWISPGPIHPTREVKMTHQKICADVKEGPMSHPVILENLQRLDNLPTLPGIAMKILEAVRSEEASLDEIADILSKDPPLTVKILGLINSAFYGLPTKVTSISHAVKLLGLNTVKKVALSFSLVRNSSKSKEGPFDYEAFWRNSLLSAVSCRLIAEKILPGWEEDAFTLGLLQDIGMLAFNEALPKQYILVIKERQKTHCDYYQAEKQILGFTHMELGGALIQKWGLPDYFYEPVQRHHLPEEMGSAEDPAGRLDKVLFLASQVGEYFSGPQKSLSLGTLKSYLEQWGLGGKIQADALIEEALRQMKDISELFDIRLEDEGAYFTLIEEARKELILISDRFLKELLEQQKRVESLKDEVMRDSLTGLFNYKSFYFFLDQEYCRARRYRLPLTLVMADIDHFKSVNDTFGHPAGDEVLRTLSHLLNAALRHSDIFARHGGEEFSILLTETPVRDSLIVVERLRQKVEAMAVEYEGQVIKVTMSFGLALLQPESSLSKDELVKQADYALYLAKRQGRNRVCVNSGS